MSATRGIYIKRYEQVTGKKYDGMFLDHGLLEIARVLGPQITTNMLQGFLPMLSSNNLRTDFWKTIDLMERKQVAHMPVPTVHDLTEPGTLIVALSYRHTVVGHDIPPEFPRRRMINVQKNDLLLALQALAVRSKASRVFVWVDQAMGQRNPLNERDWVRNGILPYFAFDVLTLHEQNDQRRCWLFLEKLISEAYSKRVVVGDKATFFTKTHQMGTISPIQEIASQVVGGILRHKHARKADDKEQIWRWAKILLEQEDANGDKFANLLGGSSWKDKRCDAAGLVAVITNHTVLPGHVEWLNLSSCNASRRWNGLSELVGLPDTEITNDDMNQIRAGISRLQESYMFNVIEARSSSDNGVTGVGIGLFRCAARPQRIVVCTLDGIRNCGDTHVLASCILDCDEILAASTGTQSFLTAFKEILETRHKESDNKILRTGDESDFLRATRRGIVEKRRSILQRLVEWSWFAKALAQKDIRLRHNYIESIQAGNIEWV